MSPESNPTPGATGSQLGNLKALCSSEQGEQVHTSQPRIIPEAEPIPVDFQTETPRKVLLLK